MCLRDKVNLPNICFIENRFPTNVPSKSLLNVRGMKGRVSSGGYSNLGARGKDF